MKSFCIIYLRKKVAYEAIDLDVIREVDVNKLEPWDIEGSVHCASLYHRIHILPFL